MLNDAWNGKIWNMTKESMSFWIFVSVLLIFAMSQLTVVRYDSSSKSLECFSMIASRCRIETCAFSSYYKFHCGRYWHVGWDVVYILIRLISSLKDPSNYGVNELTLYGEWVVKIHVDCVEGQCTSSDIFLWNYD